MMKYFAYGSNMDLVQMKKRCLDSKLIGAARLEHHRLDFTRYSSLWGCGVADVIKDPQQEVWGLLFSISEIDLTALDNYEGYPTCYTRKNVNVLCDGEIFKDVIVYYVVRKENFQKPNKKYKKILIDTSINFCFPDDYHNYLKLLFDHKEL